MYQQQLSQSQGALPAWDLCWDQIRISLCASGKKTSIMDRGFHLSSFKFSIFRVPLNHQAQGTSTWPIIGSNSHAAQANTFCYGYVMPLWLSMPFFHKSTVHLSCTLLVSLIPFYLYTISCSPLFSSLGFWYCWVSEIASSFRAGQRRWGV